MQFINARIECYSGSSKPKSSYQTETSNRHPLKVFFLRLGYIGKILASALQVLLHRLITYSLKFTPKRFWYKFSSMSAGTKIFVLMSRLSGKWHLS